MALSTADFESLLQANRIISSKLEVNEVLLTVLKLATEVVRAEASSILLLDEKTNELYFDVALGTASDSVKQIRLKMGEGIAGWVAKENKPLIVNDVSADPRFTGRVDKSTSFQTRSILALPLSAKGKLIGVIEAINKEKNQDFTAQDQEVFEAFASQSAIAIENARLFSAVKLEKEKLNTVFARMNDGVLLLDDNGITVLMNEAAGRFLGLSIGEGAGKQFGGELFPGFQSFPTAADLKNMAEETALFELSRRGIKDFLLTAYVHRLSSDEKANPGGYLIVLHDSTEEKREEKLKRNFLSLISHKLKTPLTVILGYAPALKVNIQAFSDFQKKAVQAVSEQGENLAGLVDKLLRYSIIESDDVIKKNDSVRIDYLVRKAAGFFSDLAKEKNVAFELDPAMESIPPLPLDENLALEVLKNIIENGIKFNDKDKKEIKISTKLDNGKVHIAISDNGVGIPPEEESKIFQKFYQIENSFTGQVPGAGLGLAFCKKVVEAMGGAISVQSKISKGSTIQVTFPAQ